MNGILQQIMNNPEHFSIQEITKGVQDGIIPSYIGIPIIAQKNQEAQRVQAPMQPQQPPVAQQVMQQAQQGVNQLPTQLPTQMSSGGILNFAAGGQTDDDDYDAQNQALMDYQNSGGAEYPSMDDRVIDTQQQQAMQSYMDQMQNNGNQEQPDLTQASAPVQNTSSGIDVLTPVSKIAKDAAKTALSETKKESTEDYKKVRGANHPFADKIIAEAMAQGVDPKLALGMAQNETGGYKTEKGAANATSPAGAIGVMQLMPATAKSLGVSDPSDPNQNIKGGISYIAQLSKMYNNDPHLVAAAYNAGPGNVNKYGGIPPFQETQKYVKELGFREGGIVRLASGGSVKGYANGDLVAAGNVDDTPILGNPLASILNLFRTPKDPYTSEYGSDIDTAANNMNPNIANKFMPPSTLAQVPKVLQPAQVAPDVQTPNINTVTAPYGNEAARLSNYPAPTLPESVYTGDTSSTDNTNNSSGATTVTNNLNKSTSDEPKAYTDYISYLNDRKAELEKGKSDDLNYALIQAGLGMMGGTSPFAAVNIGRGASQGLDYLMQANKLRASNQNNIQSGMMGATKADLQYQGRQDVANARADALQNNVQNRADLLQVAKQNADTRTAAERDMANAKMQEIQQQNSKLSDLTNQMRIKNQLEYQRNIWPGSPEQAYTIGKYAKYGKNEQEILKDPYAGPRYLQDMKSAASAAAGTQTPSNAMTYDQAMGMINTTQP